LRDRSGAAAVEFAAAASMLGIGLLNAIDVGVYTYDVMQVQNAARVGAQAAWKTCNDPSYMLPATRNCPGLASAITAAIQSTSLRANVSLAAGYPTEGYYCTTTSSSLQAVGTLSSKPANCSAAGNANAAPGDYLQVSVTYSYSPLFSRLSVMSASGVSAITATSWIRLG
jgi:Flp pilus assembly protein TadG